MDGGSVYLLGTDSARFALLLLCYCSAAVMVCIYLFTWVECCMTSKPASLRLAS